MYRAPALQPDHTGTGEIKLMMTLTVTDDDFWTMVSNLDINTATWTFPLGSSASESSPLRAFRHLVPPFVRVLFVLRRLVICHCQAFDVPVPPFFRPIFEYTF